MDEVKAAFDQIRAEDALIASTKDFLQRRRGRSSPVLRLAPIALCLFLLLGGAWLYFTPTAQISVEINPLVDLTLNRFGRVIRAEGGNADGEMLLEDLHLQHLSGVQAVEQIMHAPIVAELMTEGEILSVGVIGESGAQTDNLLAQMNACVSTAGESECYYATPEELQQAQELGLSCGKYRKLQHLQELHSDTTAEEVHHMTMKQLRRQIAELENAEQAQQSHGQGHGCGSGEGNGNRHGKK